MEEDGGVKAPTTRLRRRLSVEQTESPSSAPATPTKKRNTRLAAKPQLELIDENAIVNSPSKRITRKSISRDLGESEEKVVTPASRSTRVKSNTSLVSEAEEKSLTPARRSRRVKSNTSLVSEVDEKPTTPAKRNTRVKSNTSIITEAIQSVDSPRAKRATRRNSQLGSDTEAPVTPARTRRTTKTSSVDKDGTPSLSEFAATPGRTRRTRKGSTSSIDTPAEASPAEKPTSLITEVITEEPENKLRKSDLNEDNNESPTRKSPRLLAKKGRKSKYNNTDDEHEDDTNKKSKISELQSNDDSNPKTALIKSPQNDISINSKLLVKLLDCETNIKKTSGKNKSMSDVDELNSRINRNRTKSWTPLSSPAAESMFFSDNESVKKKIKNHDRKLLKDKIYSNPDLSDAPKEISINKNDSKTNLNTSKKSRKGKDNLFVDTTPETPNKSKSSEKELNVSNESNKENHLNVLPATKQSSAVEIMLENSPCEVKTTIFLEDSDSNNGSMKLRENEDQQVPIVQNTEVQQDVTDFVKENNIFDQNTEREINDSVEPMDIDETIPENVSIEIFTEEGKQSRKSLSLVQENTNKSKRKSSISNTVTQIVNNDNIVTNIGKIRKSSENIAKDDNFSNLNSSKKSRKSSQFHSITQDMSLTNENKINDTSESKNYTKNENNKQNRSERTSLSILHEPEVPAIEKSKRKSSLSSSTIQDLEKTHNENKTTLVLSQIKDISTTESNASKSPQSTIEKSIDISQTVKDGPVNKNLTLNYLTSTPVQQNKVEKLAMQMNTSVITPTNLSKKNNNTNNTSECEEIGYQKKKTKRLSESLSNESFNKKTTSKNASSSAASSSSSEDDSNEDESSRNKSKLLNDEAEDAGDDYESGDSQGDEEREYAKENEIVEKGETLNSEDDESDDSDYEKDSFIVSSDEEDNELLSGSSDDLGSSDNKLSMSAKSKKKFNERKLKEQKQASREMFNARHGLNQFDNDKSNKDKHISRSRLDSTLLKSDEENLPPKKNKRMRLESSTLENSQINPDEEDSCKNKNDLSQIADPIHKKKKSKRLSESVVNESAVNEQEMTITDTGTESEDPLSVNIKQEPKTPQKPLDISTVQIHEQMEQVRVNENASFMNENVTEDPLQVSIAQNNSSDDEKSLSENEEISNKYESMLKELNKETKKQKIRTQDISLNLNKKKKKTKEPIIEELNLTRTKFSLKTKDESKEAKEKSVKRVFKKLADTDENSRESIDLNLLFSDESNGSDGNKKESSMRDTFKPLKKAQAQTDIHISLECSSKEDEVFNFFVDTKGNFEDNDNLESNDNDAPVEVFYKSNKQSKNVLEPKESANILAKTPEKEKKKDKSFPESGAIISKTPISEKKKKKSSESHESSGDETAPDSGKKKKVSETKETENSVSEKKKKKSSEIRIKENNREEATANNENLASHKRKRKTSANKSLEHTEDLNTSQKNESICNKKKKYKPSLSIDEVQSELVVGTQEVIPIKMKKNKNTESELNTKQNNKKRKRRDDDKDEKMSKVLKEHSFDKVHVPRLPSSVIDKLENNPKKDLPERKSTKIVSTTEFIVEEAQRRKNHPSDYLEESIHIDTFGNQVQWKPISKKPKFLSFVPTVSTSDSGFTTNFKVNIIPQKMEFVAQSSDLSNFKNEYLQNKRIKKLRTYDLYKKQRNVKLSKY